MTARPEKAATGADWPAAITINNRAASLGISGATPGGRLLSLLIPGGQYHPAHPGRRAQGMDERHRRQPGSNHGRDPGGAGPHRRTDQPAIDAEGRRHPNTSSPAAHTILRPCRARANQPRVRRPANFPEPPPRAEIKCPALQAVFPSVSPFFLNSPLASAPADIAGRPPGELSAGCS